jgi:cold shock protein
MTRSRYTPEELAALPPPPEPIGFTSTTEGRCLWWYDDKGHGAIETDATAPRDVWCHFSALEMEGFKSLHEGQLVEVTYERANQDTFRYRAIRVRPK